MTVKKELAGIVGGMGPLATIELMKLIMEETPATCDQEHIPLLVYSNPKVPDRTKAILGDGPSPVKALIESSQLLENAGATFLAFPCNTAHYFLPQVEAAVSVPIINMIEETAAEVEQAGISKIGILATDGTVKTGIYQKALKARGIEAEIPDEKSQLAVMEAIYAVKAGCDLKEATQILEPALIYMSRRVDAVIAGCTELPMLLRGFAYGLTVIDTLQVLARRIVARALRS
ncbi:MAG: aspartate/glutamate racemase family protein [Firmicutes bacterium]|nr:aspartate/glutamate racemase family protein [Bacillota bacterium]HXL04607.1 amino acid racemase [Bacillota bacterium]